MDEHAKLVEKARARLLRKVAKFIATVEKSETITEIKGLDGLMDWSEFRHYLEP